MTKLILRKTTGAAISDLFREKPSSKKAFAGVCGHGGHARGREGGKRAEGAETTDRRSRHICIFMRKRKQNISIMKVKKKRTLKCSTTS